MVGGLDDMDFRAGIGAAECDVGPAVDLDWGRSAGMHPLIANGVRQLQRGLRDIPVVLLPVSVPDGEYVIGSAAGK